MSNTDISVNKPSPHFAGHAPFIPSGFYKLAESCSFVAIVTSDMDACAGVADGIATIAIASPKSWTDCHSAPASVINESTKVHPEILAAIPKGTPVVIIASVDCASNLHDKKSLQGFQTSLRSSVHCPVAFYSVQKPKTKTGPKSEKSDLLIDGMDFSLAAWLKVSGKNSVFGTLSYWCDEAVKSAAALQNGGYIALGMDATGMSNWVWSNNREIPTKISARDLFNEGTLVTVAGGAWADAKYAEYNPKTSAMVTNYKKLGADLSAACEKQGIFSIDRIRGDGVWPDPLDADSLIINGREGLWATNGTAVNRINGSNGFIYRAAGPIGISAATLQSTDEEAADLLSLLSTWSFERHGTDLKIVFGWLCSAYITSCLTWAPHCYITGPLGNGKSALATLIADLLGDGGILRDASSTESGIRQETGGRSVGIVLDEAESQMGQLQSLLGLFVSGSSGAKTSRGTAAHTAVSFDLRASGFLCGINLPEMTAAQISRFSILRLIAAPTDLKQDDHPLLCVKTSAKDLGKKLFARMANSWGRVKRALLLVDAVLHEAGHSRRFRDTYSVFIACSFVGQYDRELTEEEAFSYTETFDLSSDVDRNTAAREDVGLLDIIMMSKLPGAVERTTISTIIHNADTPNNVSATNKLLMEHGFKIALAESGARSLLIVAKHPSITAILKDTIFSRADLKNKLSAIKGFEDPKKEVRFGAVKFRPISIPLEPIQMKTNVFAPEPAVNLPGMIERSIYPCINDALNKNRSQDIPETKTH